MNAQTTVSEKGQVVIPKDVRDALGFVTGQKLDVIRSGNGVFLRPARQKSGRSTDQIVAELRALYRHEGPAVTVEQMDAAVDAMMSARTKHDL